MSLNIQISYAPLKPSRKGTTQAIVTALRTLASNPKDEHGNPGSFLLPKKYQSTVRIAAADEGIEVKTRTEGDNVRVVIIPAPPAENTLPLPLEQPRPATGTTPEQSSEASGGIPAGLTS